MFICAKCGRPSAPRERMVREVVETREVVYPPRNDRDPGGRGHQIAREQAVHAVCPPPSPVETAA